MTDHYREYVLDEKFIYEQDALFDWRSTCKNPSKYTLYGKQIVNVERDLINRKVIFTVVDNDPFIDQTDVPGRWRMVWSPGKSEKFDYGKLIQFGKEEESDVN